MKKVTETTLEIHLNTLEHNYKLLKEKLQPNTKFLAVVKAFAYGNDAVQIAKKLQTLNVDYFAVAYTNEGVALRNAGITKPILVLHPQSTNFKTLIERCLEPNIYSFFTLNTFIETAKELNQTNYPIHIKFNTGLNRLGFKTEDVKTIANSITTEKAIKVASVFSHLSASEDYNEKAFTETQISSFKAVFNNFSKALNYSPIAHICNTSGLLNYPEAHFDIVRSGIGLYGFSNHIKNSNLKPIATLKTIISQIHHIKKGESVGYNRSFIAKKSTTIATLPIGHADGISRIYGNKNGFVYIKNQKAYSIGNICMDMMMIDITNINCKEGDEVVIFDANHTAEHLAEHAKTISYELITALSHRIKRVFIDDV